MQRRQLNQSRVLHEADWITTHKIIQDVAVLDPTFNSGPNYLPVLDRLHEGKYSGKLFLQCRAEIVNSDFINRVKK